jgi:TolB protein
MRTSVRIITGSVGVLAAVASLLVGANPAAAVVPGTNGPIVFETNRDGNSEIYIMNPDGSEQVNLTNNPFSDVFPSLSPDSTKITFSSDRAEPGNADVYVMNNDGSGVTRLTNAPGEDRGASWTSDGEKIVFHSTRDRDATHTFDIFIMNPDGTNQTKLFTNGSAAYACGDSETGKIVFNSNGDPLGTNPANGTSPTTGAPLLDFEIFTIDIDGSNVEQVTNNTVLDSGPKWSPDCSQISYNSLDTTSLDVFRIDADGSNRTNLTNAPGVFDAFSAWSPDGQRIVFSSNRDGNFEIYTMDSSDGGNLVRLTNTAGVEFRADWGVPARVTLDDTARGNATRAQVTGTFTCPAGEVFVVSVELTQDATTGRGTARGTCTGESQSVVVTVMRTSGPGFAAGPAEACTTASNASRGSRTENDEIELCNTVTITP